MCGSDVRDYVRLATPVGQSYTNAVCTLTLVMIFCFTFYIFLLGVNYKEFIYVSILEKFLCLYVPFKASQFDSD